MLTLARQHQVYAASIYLYIYIYIYIYIYTYIYIYICMHNTHLKLYIKLTVDASMNGIWPSKHLKLSMHSQLDLWIILISFGAPKEESRGHHDTKNWIFTCICKLLLCMSNHKAELQTTLCNTITHFFKCII